MIKTTLTVSLSNGTRLTSLGQGTWGIGENFLTRNEEIRSLQLGIDLGLNIIDTAEMYGHGASEQIIGEALKGRREQAFIITKFLPVNATKEAMLQSCRRSLKNLGIECIDLYLLHWRGSTPFAETLQGFEALREEGLIRYWGVSNFDIDDLEELSNLGSCSANEILYSLDYRGVEYDLLDYHRKAGILTIAYSPLGQGGYMLRNPILRDISVNYQTSLGTATPGQIALAWVLRRPNIIAIPKAATLQHVRENAVAREIVLLQEDLKKLDAVFHPPQRKVPLAVL